MLKITVLTPTCRDDFLEWQIKALKQQTFTDYEWVLVDDLYSLTKERAVALVNGTFPLIHIPPNKREDYPVIASACNDGLIYARGRLVFFMNDYVLPHPNCLQRHWEIYQKYPDAMISGRGLQVGFKPEQLDTLKGDEVVADYRRGLFDNHFFKREKLGTDLYEAFRDGIQNWWAGRNDSAPLEAILECNGFDETFDGRWGGQDADLAQRLMTYGLRYLLDTKSICLEFEHVHGLKKAIRTEREQQEFQHTIIDYKVKRGIHVSGIERDLRKERYWKRLKWELTQ
mgnify:CR=1 FL=1